MILAGMIRTDETALICDMAEEYGVYDWRALELQTAAALAAGLRDDSRIKMKIAGMPIDMKTMLAAVIADRLSFIAWTKTKDAEAGRNRPESILLKIMNAGKEEEKKYEVFRSPEEFEKAWRMATEAPGSESDQ